MSALDSLPRANDKRVALRVTKDALRQIRGGHPWVYESSITQTSHEGHPGDLAVVFDDNRRFVAIGLFDPDSPLRMRVLHRHKPRSIDAEFWFEAISTALDIRAPLAEDPDTNAYRCIHGENDGLPGLVVDRYDDTYVVKLDTAAWLVHLRDVVPVLAQITGAARIVLRLSRSTKADAELMGISDGAVLLGTAAPDVVPFRENGLRFDADVVRGQKTGHFLDQRDNRQRVRHLADGRRVLDMFSCTGGFGVYAAAGGAASLHSVDVSPHAIEATARNLAANADIAEVAACVSTSTVGDAFAVMRSLVTSGRRFDLVIVDPPSFASKNSDVGSALGAYATLTELSVRLLERGGILVQSSCSSRVRAEDFYDAIAEAAMGVGRRLAEMERTQHALDHPIGFAQGAYLKTLFAQVP